MEYLFVLLLMFIVMLFVMQIFFFEMARRKMKRIKNVNWFLSLNRPFAYTRVKYMIFVCVLCYLFSGIGNLSMVEWLLYMVLFVAIGIVADAIVQYLTMQYSKIRCRKEIQEAVLLENELLELTQTMYDDEEYEISPLQYNETQILKQYLQPQDHLAIMSIDQGTYADSLDSLPEATFVVEPYGDINPVKEKFAEKQVKVTQLTPSGQLPFKDNKMDIIMCEYCNYDKFEIERTLKNQGYFIVNQKGTTDLKEFYQFYLPFGMKGSWDSYACSTTLQDIGMKVIDKIDDYGTLRFHTIQSIHTYFKKFAPDFANINKYKVFYLNALKDIKEKSFCELSTHRFYVVAQKNI